MRDFWDAVTALATVATAVAAWLGVSTWRQQMRGQAKFDIARRLLASANDLADKFHGARNHFIATNEEPVEAATWVPQYRASLEGQTKLFTGVFTKRWTPVAGAGAHMLSLLPEAKIFLPADVAARAQSLLDCASRLLMHMNDYIRLVGEDYQHMPAGVQQQHDEEFKAARWGVFAGSIAPVQGDHADALQKDFRDLHSQLTDLLMPFVNLQKG